MWKIWMRTHRDLLLEGMCFVLSLDETVSRRGTGYQMATSLKGHVYVSGKLSETEQKAYF